MNINSKIKFTRQNKPEFIRELRENVYDYFTSNNISKYGNFSIVLKSVLMALLCFVPYVLMISGLIHPVLLILLAWVIMGTGMAGMGMVLMHDANHGSYSKNARINKLFSKSLYLLGGFPPSWRYQHNTLHHGFTNIEGHDEDIAPAGILRFSPHARLRNIHRFQQWYAWFFYGLMTLSWVTISDFTRLASYRKREAPLSNSKNYRRLFADLIAAKIFYYSIFLCIPILVLPISWYWTILFFITMHFVSGLILSTIFQTAHVMPSSNYPLPDENGNIENDWAVHQLLTTSDYAPKSKIFSWLIGGLNYQIEHHLFPNISHVHYRKISPLVKIAAHRHNLPYSVQPSFFLALRNHFRMLKHLGRPNSETPKTR